MRARHHALIGAVAATAVVPVFGPYSAVFWASSVVIDGDHYIDYLCRNRLTDFSVRKMFDFHSRLYLVSRESNFLGLNVCHTVEFIALAGAVAYLLGWTWLIAAFWGMLFHFVTDIVYLASQKRLFRRALSIIEYGVRWNLMKRSGGKPEEPYVLTLAAMSAADGSRESNK